MPASKVRGDYASLAQIAEGFGREANNSRQSLQRITSKLDVLRGGDWVGTGADKFYQEMDSAVLPAQKRLIAALEEAQRTTQKIGQIIHRAEDDAAALFKASMVGAALSAVAGAAAGSAIGGAAAGGKSVFGKVLGFVGDLFVGAGSELVDMVKGIGHLIAHPIDTLKGLAYGITHPGELWDAFTKPFVEDWNSGNPGRAIGRGLIFVGSFFVGAGEAKAVGTAGRAGEVASRAGRLGELGETAGRAGRLGEVGEAAGRTGRLGEAGEVAGRTGRLGEAGEAAGAAGRTTEVAGGAGRVGETGGAAARSWDDLVKLAEQPTPRQTTGGFRSSIARDGTREVRIIEGPVGGAIDQGESMARYGSTMQGEHATHSVGMQLGENLPEGLTSAPARFNLSEMKVVENSIRETADAAAAVGAKVETRTVLKVEHVMQGADEVPVLVGVEREAWLVVPGTDTTIPFADFSAHLDPVTRTVVTERNWVLRPQR